MDINPFEIAGKTVRRSYETVLDSYMCAESSMWDWLPGKPFNKLKQESSDNIMSAAKTALRHDDLAEASHQLKRELYFTSLVDDLSNSKDERAAHAGLDAIAHGRTASEVNAVIQSTGQERGFINTIRQQFDNDLNKACKNSMFASSVVQADIKYHRPQLGQDAAWLARNYLSFTDFQLELPDAAAAQTVFREANKNIELARRNGVDVRELQKEADRTKLLLPREANQ